ARVGVGALESAGRRRRLRAVAGRPSGAGARGERAFPHTRGARAHRLVLRVSVRVLSEHDVYRLLPVADCIEPVRQVLAALTREELYNPLRFVVRPPEAGTLMGLMPAHQSGPAPVYSLKAVCIIPGNAARGLDSHQGFVALFDGENGKTR